MGSENLNPLDELMSLDQQIQKIPDLAGLKPIFYRLDEIAKQNPHDFDVQLAVGDIKQHLVNRGTRIKEMQQQTPPVVAPPAPPTPSTTLRQPQQNVTQQPEPVQPPPVPPMAPGTTLRQHPIPPGESQQASPSGAAPPPLPPDATMIMRSPFLDSEQNAEQEPFPTTETATPPMPLGMSASFEVPQAASPKSGQAPPVLPPTGGPQQAARPVSPPVSQAPRTPVQWRRALLLGALVGAVIAVILIAVLVNQARKRNLFGAPAPIQVAITTTPPGASIRVNGEQKCTSNCSLPLAPGDYQITAFLDGYEPAASGMTVTAGQPGSANLTLEPQPQTFRILTDLDQGKVTFDDQPPADLQDGQFIVDKVAPGAHTVKIAGPNADATFSFEIAVAQPPSVTGTVMVKNLVAVLVSSFGSHARVITNSGPMKLALNGQPQGDAGPAGLDLTNFQPGVDELVVGEGKDERNMKENFGPVPMLTAFLKSDLNIGTLIVSTGEDNAQVFVNDKVFRRKTQRGEVRIPAIGKVAVRVVKDGFQAEPQQLAEVKKGAEVRLEFKLKPLPQVAMLQIRGATAGTEVLIDQKSAGTVGGDGNFTASSVQPGDHTIELRREQFVPKSVQRSFKAGQTVELAGSEVVLASANATVKLALTPADATVSYRRDEETQTKDLRGNQIELPPGTYVFAIKAPGFVDRAVRFSVAGGETRSIDIKLVAREAAPPPVVVSQAGTMSEFENATAWRKEGDQWVHKGGGFIPYKLSPKGTFTFTVTLVHGGSLFRGGRIRWALQYVDAKNYDLFEMDKKTFWSKVVDKGKTLERTKAQHNLENEKSYTVEVEVTPDRVVHRIMSGGQWVPLDTWSEPGRNFTEGKFGFLIQGNDEVGVSDFKFQPK